MSDGSLGFGLTTFTSLFAIVDPFAALPVYLALTAPETERHRREIAVRATLTCLGVLMTFALGGGVLFKFFGISIPAFKIAGGLLLFGVALETMRAKVSSTRSTPDETQEASHREDIGLMPIGIPLLSGPGAIASATMFGARAHGVMDHVALVGAVMVLALLVWIILRGAVRVARVLGATGMKIVGRLMGLILAAVATQFVIDGVKEAFPMLG